MSMSKRFLSLAAIVAVSAFSYVGFAHAGEDAAPKAPTADAPKPAAETAKTDADAPKTPTPMHSILGWIASQVAPGLEKPCASTPEGEKAWRAWFAGGKDVKLAGLRDALVAQGWTADRTVSFFKEMAAKSGGCKDCKDCDGAKDCGDAKDCGGAKDCDGAKGDCPEGKCPKTEGAKGDCPQGKCPKEAEKAPESTPAPAKP